MRIFQLLLLLIVFSSAPSFCRHKSAGPQQAVDILNQALKANESVDRIYMTMRVKERIDGEYIRKKFDLKIDYKPFRVYARQYYPGENLEAIYPDEDKNPKMLVNWNNIPFAQIRIDPLSRFVRKNTHHSVNKAGFNFMVLVIEHLLEKYSDRNSVWQYAGEVKYDKIHCYKLIFTSPDFHYFTYTIKEGETLEDLTNKYKICDYMILEHNPEIKYISDIKPGTKLKLPSDYAKQIIIYLEKERVIPIGVKVYDEKGLFEDYLYKNIKINPIIKKLDFDSNNPDYGFM